MSLEHSPARQRRSSPRQLFDPDQLYSAKEVRDRIGGKTHIVTIWNWVKAGRLPKPMAVGPNTKRFLGRDLNERLLPEAAAD